ncbi:MAG: methyl-accepting chemotaxis protein, partial [Pseudomonadota bacterium]|nr:methyl-accepting chemotaxis protein [Pseudomonadota bacterium]
MSTVMDAVAGKSRNLGTNFWLLLLVGSIAVLGANTAYSTFKAARLGGASTSAADLQVLSQQLAVQGREAVEGDPKAFATFKATKQAIESDVATLTNRFGNEATVSDSIQDVANRWKTLGGSAEQVISSEKAVLDLAGSAERFTSRVPQLQAQLDEVVRAMSASGSPSSQVYIALREVVLASTMARRIAEIRAGGATASLAGQALARDAAVFDQVMTGLRQGGSGNAQRVTAPAAVAALNQANTQWVEMKKDLDALLGSSQNLFRAQAAAAAITAGSDAMLADSKTLFSDFTAFGSMRDTSLLGNIWLSIFAGIGMILGLAGLLFSLYRAQERRRGTVEELNNRNQEAIMRLLDEMGSLAEGDLTVKATVTEDMTGAIADSINFAIEQLRSLVQTITDTSVQVASSAQETQATAMQLAEAAEHQAQEISSASDRISE